MKNIQIFSGADHGVIEKNVNKFLEATDGELEIVDMKMSVDVEGFMILLVIVEDFDKTIKEHDEYVESKVMEAVEEAMK